MQYADKELYARHANESRPNLLFDKDGNPISISKTKEYEELVNEWTDLYNQSLHGNEKQSDKITLLQNRIQPLAQQYMTEHAFDGSLRQPQSKLPGLSPSNTDIIKPYKATLNKKEDAEYSKSTSIVDTRPVGTPVQPCPPKEKQKSPSNISNTNTKSVLNNESKNLKFGDLIDTLNVKIGEKLISVDALSNGFIYIQDKKFNKETKKYDLIFKDDGTAKMVYVYDNNGDHQCVKLISKYLVALGVKADKTTGLGNGVAISNNLADKYFEIDGIKYNFKSHANGSTTLPKPGSVISGKASTHHGHVVIAKEVTLSKDEKIAEITVIEQNGGYGEYGDTINRKITLEKGEDGGWSGYMYKNSPLTGWANIDSYD